MSEAALQWELENLRKEVQQLKQDLATMSDPPPVRYTWPGSMAKAGAAKTILTEADLEPENLARSIQSLHFQIQEVQNRLSQIVSI